MTFAFLAKNSSNGRNICWARPIRKRPHTLRATVMHSRLQIPTAGPGRMVSLGDTARSTTNSCLTQRGRIGNGRLLHCKYSKTSKQKNITYSCLRSKQKNPADCGSILRSSSFHRYNAMAWVVYCQPIECFARKSTV